MELMVLVCITLAKSVSANWHQSTTSVDGMEHLGNAPAETPRRRRRRAVEAPLQVRGGVFPDEAPVVSREGSQAVTDARRSTSTPRAASGLREVALLLGVEPPDVSIGPPGPRCVCHRTPHLIQWARLDLCVTTVK